ncbi:MAG: hypothetical protein IJ031_07720, partial [Oscillospiraceae bacterium]|nr:hypothetical protein [Oscillospiraceae bacterium]
MLKKQQKNQPKNNEKFFSKDNMAGIIAFAVIILTVLYVISTHLNLPTFIVPSDAVEITYPSSIISVPVKEQADNMKGTEGIYRVKINDDGSLTVKMSPDRYQKIAEAAENAVESMMLIAIGEETAVRDYSANEEKTVFDLTVNPDSENFEKEISDAIYVARLYLVCFMNLDVEITFNFKHYETEELYLTET